MLLNMGGRIPPATLSTKRGSPAGGSLPPSMHFAPELRRGKAGKGAAFPRE